MKYQVDTESGSVYTLDDETLTFEAVKSAVSCLRTSTGKLNLWPVINVGESMHLICPPINPHADVRIIVTSPVVRYQKLG